MILGWWRHLQRSIDVKVLWPSCLEMAVDRAHAEAAFLLHMELDAAYRGMDEDEKRKFVERLPTCPRLTST